MAEKDEIYKIVRVREGDADGVLVEEARTYVVLCDVPGHSRSMAFAQIARQALQTLDDKAALSGGE